MKLSASNNSADRNAGKEIGEYILNAEYREQSWSVRVARC